MCLNHCKYFIVKCLRNKIRLLENVTGVLTKMQKWLDRSDTEII